MFATNCPDCIPIVVSDLCCCDLLCELCPKTCLQPTVPNLSQLFCLVFVAVLCCVNLVPKHVCNQLSQCRHNCCVWFLLLWCVVWILSQHMFAASCPNFVPLVLRDLCCCICCVNFVPKHVCNQLPQLCPNCGVWFLLLCCVVWPLSQNMFATNSQNVGPTVMCDVRSCDVLFEFCPNTCLQPAVPMLSHLFCVICVAVICCLAPFIPGTVAGMARRAFGYIYIYIYT